MKKFFRKVHLWLAVPFGLVITLICFSGAMLMFEDEVRNWTHHDLLYVKEVKETPLSIEQILDKVAITLPDSVAVTGVNILSNPERTYQVSLSKPRRASLYVDPYTGEITGKNQRGSFFMFMFRLHRWLLDSMNPGGEGIFWGKIIVGTATLLFVFVLLSGIVIWWPRTRKALKNSLQISVTKGWKRFWYNLHVAGGMYAFVFLLALALTGLTWSFPWYRMAFYKVFGAEVQQLHHGGAPHGGGGERRGGNHGQIHKEGYRGDKERSARASEQSGREYPPASPFVHWQKVYDALRTQCPGYKQITLSDGTAGVSYERFGNRRASDRYTFDNRTGELTGITPYEQQDKASKLRGWIYSVHVGGWGGLLTRILTFMAALIGASLPLTGYYFWIKKTMNKRKRSRETR